MLRRRRRVLLTAGAVIVAGVAVVGISARARRLGPGPEPVRWGDRPEPPAYAEWMQRNAHPIVSLASDTFVDLDFLRQTLAARRVVQLGESAHGVAQFEKVKVRLIKYLHEALGYDVLAFESSLYECYQANEAADTLAADALMRGCINRLWHTREMLPLFEYIKATRRTAHPLILAGFDDQITSPVLVRRRPAFFAGLVGGVAPSYARRVAATDSIWIIRSWFRPDSAREHRREMVGFYDSLATFLTTHAGAIAAQSSVVQARVDMGAVAARNAARLVEQLANLRTGVALRDRVMADNLDFLLDRLYAGKKVITWGHNIHVSRKGSSVEPYRMRDMGEWIAERRGTEVYTIGVFMYEGVSAGPNQAPIPVVAMPRGGLEHIMASAGSAPAVMVDLTQQRPETGNAWMFKPIQALEGGTQAIRFVPREQYDGLLLVRKATPPSYMH